MSRSIIYNFKSSKQYRYLRSVFKYGVPSETEIISERTEGNVYKFFHEDETFVIKERKTSSFGDDVCNVCVLREYVVGAIINKYKSPFLVETIAYFEYEGSSFIVTRYIIGASLSSMISPGGKYNTKTVSLQVFEIIFHMLYTLGITMEFTHYDLHDENIMIGEMDEPYTYHLIDTDGNPFTIVSKYKITFIDLSRSHVKDVPEMYCESGTLDTATVPGVFDPMFDMAWIVGIMLTNISYQEDDTEIKQFLVRNQFNIDPSHGIVGYPITPNFYLMGDLFQEDKIWAATTASYRDITVAKVNHKYAKFLLKVADRLNLKPTDEDIDPEYPIEDKANSLPRSYMKYYDVVDVIELYIKLLGLAMVHDKIIGMSLRLNNVAEMLTSCLSYVDRLRNQL
jgi:serine/threonine protein kinase